MRCVEVRCACLNSCKGLLRRSVGWSQKILAPLGGATRDASARSWPRRVTQNAYYRIAFAPSMVGSLRPRRRESRPSRYGQICFTYKIKYLTLFTIPIMGKIMQKSAAFHTVSWVFNWNVVGFKGVRVHGDRIAGMPMTEPRTFREYWARRAWDYAGRLIGGVSRASQPLRGERRPTGSTRPLVRAGAPGTDVSGRMALTFASRSASARPPRLAR
jgi:hypothetical protein